MKDYYKYLGIDSSASHEEVKQAYKKTASYFTSKESLNENEKLMVQKIRAAFSILKDYHKRRDYDNIREGLGKNKRNQFDTIALRTFEPVKQNFLKPFSSLIYLYILIFYLFFLSVSFLIFY